MGVEVMKSMNASRSGLPKFKSILVNSVAIIVLNHRKSICTTIINAKY